MQHLSALGRENVFVETACEPAGEESQTTSVFFTGMNLVTETVRSEPVRADSPLTLTPLWDGVRGGQDASSV